MDSVKNLIWLIIHAAAVIMKGKRHLKELPVALGVCQD